MRAIGGILFVNIESQFSLYNQNKELLNTKMAFFDGVSLTNEELAFVECANSFRDQNTFFLFFMAKNSNGILKIMIYDLLENLILRQTILLNLKEYLPLGDKDSTIEVTNFKIKQIKYPTIYPFFDIFSIFLKTTSSMIYEGLLFADNENDSHNFLPIAIYHIYPDYLLQPQ